MTVGRFTYGHTDIELSERGDGASLVIGSFCSIAPGLKVMLGGNHRTDWATTYPFGHVFAREMGVDCVPGHPVTRGDVVIGNDVWIGKDVTIVSGVHIGNGAVIAAGSMVSKSVGAYEIWGGNPARLIRSRFSPDLVEALLSLKWWDWPTEDIIAAITVLCAPPSVAALDDLRRPQSDTAEP